MQHVAHARVHPGWTARRRRAGAGLRGRTRAGPRAPSLASGRANVRRMTTMRAAVPGLALVCALSAPEARAQIDPVQRRVFQAGYTQPMQEHGPLEAYGFYYHNEPNFFRTNITL